MFFRLKGFGVLIRGDVSEALSMGGRLVLMSPGLPLPPLAWCGTGTGSLTGAVAWWPSSAMLAGAGRIGYSVSLGLRWCSGVFSNKIKKK